MGFSQAGVPVDEKGVVVLGGVLRHGHGGGVGQLIGGAHYEVVEGEFGVGKAVCLPLRGPAALVFQKARVVENLHLEIRGENVVEGGFDVVEKQGLQVSPFEVAGAVEVTGIALDVHDAKFVEPGGNGGLGERPPKLAQDILPNVGDGIQKGNTSLFCLVVEGMKTFLYYSRKGSG